jgi:acyl transferase domain-containing protein/enoyl-CoA hydratase/carnithine racemase/acyl carrier protein
VNAEEIFQALRSGAVDRAEAERRLAELREPAEATPPAAPLHGPASLNPGPTGDDGPAVRWRWAEPGVALVTMDSREEKNAFTPALIDGLTTAFLDIQTEPDSRVVVLSGTAAYFATGGTKDGLLAIQNGTVRFTDIDIYSLALDCDIPVVAAMQGHAIGAGWALGMFCDFVVFAAESYYTSNYMTFGFTPGAGATLVFPERFGTELAREILFTGDRYRGSELRSRGVPFPVVPRPDVLAEALGTARKLAASPRAALVGLKSLLSASLRERLAGTFEREAAMHERTFVGQPEVLRRIEAALPGGNQGNGATSASRAAADVVRPRAVPARSAGPPAIAVIGMAGQFPRAGDVDQFWANLATGRDCVSEVPDSRWSLEYFDPNPNTPGRTYGRWMGVLEDADAFDPLFFAISPVEAEQMDPQQRVFLTSAWHCIEDAGIRPSSLAGSRCGVFVGVGPGDYGQYLMARGENPHGFTGAACSILGSRISYLLDLAGPSMAIDTSCSSSGVAISQACDSLVLGASDLALAGGVCVLSGPATHLMTSRAGMLSTDGRCRTFDNDATGFVPGEGVGVLLLKRLEDAVRDGDPIRGVIRGWGVNQDGRTNGITAPSGAAQTRLERDVYDRFGIDPRTIGMVEAHGTATRLGDPIEVEALVDTFAGYTEDVGYCALGSVKSNIGHLLSAAAVAGVFKALLALRHATIPPTLHMARLNEHIRLDGSPFYVNTEVRPWPADDGTPRRAAVSSFGFSGTNCHLVLEEHRPSPRAAAAPGEPGHPVVLPLSAQTPEQLRQYANSLREFLASGSAPDLPSVAYTLQVGRDPRNHRVAVFTHSRAELVEALGGYAGGAPTGPWLTGMVEAPSGGSADARNGSPVSPVTTAEAWVAGHEVDWSALYPGGVPGRTHVPGYPFATERYWLPAFRESLRAVPPPLSRPAGGAVTGAGAVPAGTGTPGGAVLELLVAQLSELLRIPSHRIGASTAFSDIGVESLTVRRLIDRLEEHFGETPVEAFFTHKTVGGLAEFLAGRPGPSAGPRRPVEVVEPPVAAPEPGAHGVAVVGISGRYPKASSLEEFWVNLEFARDCTVEIPRQRWDHRQFGRMYCRWGGFLDDVELFDAAHFQISPREARFMDPQERLFLEVASVCLEGAGYGRERLADPRVADGGAPVGVFVGATYNNYQLLQAEALAAGGSALVNSQTYSIANRVSYVFNLRGPSLTVDTACSSSLVALHLAAESIARGECEMALAGGVNLSLHPTKYLSLCAARFASTDGYCRAFGQDGDGYVPGEGVGAVLLKPLARAVADGDHIHAVIRGTAVNNDGRTFGYSVPNPRAQTEVIRQALDRAGVDARTISYVEAHGTGTKLGDPVEVAGLTEAYSARTGERQYCAIGSVKSNIGHLEAAAGIAQLTKVILQLSHRTLAASLPHADELNPHIDFARTPFRVQLGTAPWDRPVIDGVAVPRRAGLSSFGAGGVNAHAVVEEYRPAPRSTGRSEGSVLVVLSAKRADRLRDYARVVAARVASAGDQLDPADVAFTLQTGRDALPFRLAFVARDRAEMMVALDGYATGRPDPELPVHTGEVGPAGPPTPAANGSGIASAPEPVTGPGAPTGPAGAPDLELVARRWVAGGTVDWSALHDSSAPPRRVPLPTHPLRGDRYWPTPAPGRSDPRPTLTLVPAPVPAPESAEPSALAAASRPAAPSAAVPDLVTTAQPAAAPAAPGPLPARAPERAPLTATPGGRPGGVVERPDLLAALCDALDAEKAELLAEFMQRELAELLEYEPSDLPETRRGFFDMGMESVMVERFRSTLERELLVSLPDTVLFDFPTIEALTAHLADTLPWAEWERSSPPPDTPPPVVPPPRIEREWSTAGGEPASLPDRPGRGPGLVAAELRDLLVRLGEIR